MAPELMSITVRIYGWDYVLRVDPSQVDRAKAIADYIDQRMHEIASRSGTVDTLKLAIRANLTITDELFDAQEQLKQLQTLAGPPPAQEVPVQDKLDELSNLIDKELESYNFDNPDTPTKTEDKFDFGSLGNWDNLDNFKPKL